MFSKTQSSRSTRINTFKSITTIILMLILSPVFAATYEGRLHKLTGDNPKDKMAVEHYYLIDQNKKWHKLHLTPEILKKLGPIHQWQGNRFQVETRDAAGAARADSVPVVIDVQPLPEKQVGPMSTTEDGTTAAAVSRPWINILVRFADDPNPEPNPSSFYSDLFSSTYPGLDHYWQEVSYNAIDIQGSEVVGWYTLPQDRDYYINDDNNPDFSRTVEDATAVADADVYFPDYEGINIFFSDSFARGWGGSSTVTRDGVTKVYSTTWLPSWTHDDHPYVVHEMGHGFGLPHSSGPYDTPYDSNWDPMSNSFGSCGSNEPHPDYNCISVHTIGYHKNLLGWIPEERIVTLTESTYVDELVNLERVAQPDFASDRPTLLRLPLANGDFYTVESRLRIGYDANIPAEAVVIHEVSPGRDRPAQVVDATDDGNPNDAGAQWIPGETAVLDGGWSVSIDEQNQDYFTVRVNRGDQPPQGDGLNLEVWNPGQTSSHSKVAARITNYTDTPVQLNRLSVKAWINDQGYDNWAPANYPYNQSIYDANGNWVTNVDSATSVSLESMGALLECGNDRTANREVTIRYEASDSLYIPANGGYVTTNMGGDSAGTWHRADWLSIDRSEHYSRITDAGNEWSTRANLPRFAVYKDGQLITESLSSSEPDPNTGREPCNLD